MGSQRWTGMAGEVLSGSTELDPLGVDAGLTPPPEGQPPASLTGCMGRGEITNPATGCGIDNIPAPVT